MLISIALAQLPVSAQYLGLNLRGDMGLKVGSQPGPGLYLIAPLWYRNDYEGLRGAKEIIASGLNLDINILTTPAIAVTTKAKIAGATYGFQIIPMVMNNRIELAALGRGGGESYGFGDMYIQPINLGWRAKRADFLLAYGLYPPPEQVIEASTCGLTKSLQEPPFTWIAAKKLHVSTTGSYEIHQNKRGIDLKSATS